MPLLSIINIFHLAAITGGLDSKLAAWDFSKGRTLFSIDYGTSFTFHGTPVNSVHYLRLLHVLFVFVKEYPSSSLISYISIKHW
jgi:hypothetical protein